MTDRKEQEAYAAWGPILDDLAQLMTEAWDRSRMEIGLQRDPRMVSVQLFKRLRDHRNAFVMLFNARLTTDAEIICRSAIEVAICLVNLNTRGAAFVDNLRSDAANTVRGQLPIWNDDDPEFGDEARNDFDLLFGTTRKDGSKHARFEWKSLAEQAASPELYRWYKHLSGTAAHVTGISIFMDTILIDEPGSNANQIKFRRLRRTNALSMMCGAAQVGCRSHANSLGYVDIEAKAAAIMARMDEAGAALSDGA